MNNLIVSMWEKNKFFYEANLSTLTNDNYLNRLTQDTSSGGFLALHTAESLLYSVMLLGYPVQLPELTTFGASDTGQGNDLDKVKSTFLFALETMTNAVKSFSDEDMTTIIDTYIGPITKAEFIAYTMHHTGYHLGQAASAIKRGKVFAMQAAA